MLQALSRHCEVLSVLLKFAGSWDLVIWLLRSMSRCAGGSARFCEFLYLYGPGSSGKDVVMLLFLMFFGEGPDNLGCVLNGSFIVDAHGGQVNKEAASPFLAATQGKRFIWVSEVPQHKNLQIDLIKQYCEQHGAPMTCRKLYTGPVVSRPIGMIAAASNYAVPITNKDDDGFHRRQATDFPRQATEAHGAQSRRHAQGPHPQGRIQFTNSLAAEGSVGELGKRC